jgi:hypothetical protein
MIQVVCKFTIGFGPFFGHVGGVSTSMINFKRVVTLKISLRLMRAVEFKT